MVFPFPLANRIRVGCILITYWVVVVPQLFQLNWIRVCAMNVRWKWRVGIERWEGCVTYYFYVHLNALVFRCNWLVVMITMRPSCDKLLDWFFDDSSSFIHHTFTYLRVHESTWVLSFSEIKRGSSQNISLVYYPFNWIKEARIASVTTICTFSYFFRSASSFQPFLYIHMIINEKYSCATWQDDTHFYWFMNGRTKYEKTKKRKCLMRFAC